MPEDNKFNARKGKSFDYITEIIKLLITLAAGLLAFTVTFEKENILGELKNLTHFNKTLLGVCWLCCFTSIFSGIIAFSNLSGQLMIGETENTTDSNPMFRNSAAELFMRIQQSVFLMGFFYFCIFGLRKLEISFLERTAQVFIGLKTFIIIMVIAAPVITVVILIIIHKIFNREPAETYRAYFNTTADGKGIIRYDGTPLAPKTLLWMSVIEKDVDDPFTNSSQKPGD